MRKISVIGASLLLLALGSCSREKDITPADGFVKMRFTAVVGDTRTAYDNDKTASWVAGDAISVYVTNGTDGQVVTFTADESLTFEGNVPAGYTTIVAGAYPADAAHTFDANGVKTIHFPASYTLAAGADPASVLPLAGTFANGVMSFTHPAGALKFTIDNVPATAVRFRFTTFGHKINGNYALDAELDDTLVDAEKSVDINFPAAAGSHTFYVPMPAGELYAESVIQLFDADNKVVFKKVAPQAITVSKNVIKRIAAVTGWTKNEEWQAAYLRDVYNTSTQKVVSYVMVSGTTGNYDIALYAKSTFDTQYGSAEAFLASNYIPNKKANGTKPKTKNATWAYNRLSPGAKTVVLFGLDDDYNFTGEYNLIEFEVPEFTQPEDWHLTFNPSYNVSGSLHPAVHVQVPEGTSWSTGNFKKEDFQSEYGGDAIAYIWSRTLPANSVTIRTSTNINLYFSSLDEGDYVYIVYGVREAEQTGGNRILSYEYAVLEYTYTKPSDEPTDAYKAWLGKWSVTDESKTDTWTISAKENNASYSISGLIARTTEAFTVVGVFNTDGTLSIKAQKGIGTTTYKASDGNTYDVTLNLYGRKESSGSAFSGTYNLLKATLDASNPNAATLAPAGTTYFYYTFYGSYVNANGDTKGVGYGTRSATATMTRVVSDEVLAPDGWGVAAEEFIQGPESAVMDEAIPAE
jgi:hypothetical protein